MLSGSKKVDIFLKKKSAQLAKKKKEEKGKVAERKELLNHLRLVAKLETEVNCKQNYGFFSNTLIPIPPHGIMDKLKSWFSENF